ncbi:hypothetical protein ADK67_07015 [Saccharothrix sp. NRRL B-16348]|uniref:hypothetical protein n=1 Tax=Saccharothrix sp. NRRL B-16348 TaxID=1415542 RepID=UPI0006ADF859|nr:hypothetical protein [Saccharothrix sp. NRRL B-16348]KOX33274.1 hypothetical protein ADK67_07015 [Saccharothrix sp. NRRL B-16348]
MGELGRSGSVAVVGVVMVALVACGSDAGSGDLSASSLAPVSTASSPTATSSRAPSTSAADLCTDLYAFSASAGPVFSLARLALADGETPEERRTVDTHVSSMALFGLRLAELPEAGPHFRAVALAAAEAKRALADGVPAMDATAALDDEPTAAARETAVAYRGDC